MLIGRGISYPIMNTPVSQALSILDENGTNVWTADLVEDGDPDDPDAAKYRDAIGAWHGLSKNGSAEGELIYANYGFIEDYDELEAMGVNFTGKIVITRYGKNFRGLKVGRGLIIFVIITDFSLKIKRAAELGAAGVLIFSDPRDDGHVRVENGYAPWPAGPARSPSSVQRGSVQYLSIVGLATGTMSTAFNDYYPSIPAIPPLLVIQLTRTPHE